MVLRRLYAAYKIFLCILAITFCSMAYSTIPQEELDSAVTSNLDPVTFGLFAEENSIQPGHSQWLAVKINLEKGWHSYWKNPGSTGIPIQIDWDLPEGFKVEEIRWPFPTRFEQSGLIGYGYEDNATLLVRLLPPKEIPFSLKEAAIEAEVRWLACSDSHCVPGETSLSLNLPISTATPTSNVENSDLFSKALSALPKENWQLQARKTNDLIEIQIQAPEGIKQNFSSAHFFPEAKGSINEKLEPTLKQEEPGIYVVAMNELENARSETLKGILVLRNETSTEAIDVKVAVKRPVEEDAVGMTEPVKIKKAKVSKSAIIKEEFEGGMGLALLFAFLGGLILNLMPCVFPVISFKILSFVNMSGKSRSVTFLHGAAFSGGVLVSFWLFAVILIVLKMYGHEAGWGFQLQQPLFVAFLAALLLVFALSLFGVFEFGISMSSMAGDAVQKAGHSSSALVGSFFSGMLATALATPCTGPFMAPALGFAATLPAFWALTIFTALGLGMASPYLLLSAFPSLLRVLPKPGPWMTTFKQLMGFLMLATVLWLVSVFGAQTGTLGLLILLGSFFFIAVAAWIYGHYCLPSSTKRVKLIGAALAGIFAIMSIYTISVASSPEMSDNKEIAYGEWENFSLARLEQLEDEGRPVFIDFTAKWCLVCQANHLILSTEEVSGKLHKNNVVKMKADWTRSDPEITAMLRKFGRNGVPLYVLYGKDHSKPQVLPQVLTPRIVSEALEKI